VLPGTPEERLDRQLRMGARLFDRAWGDLEPLIAEARARGIHKHVGFKSWPAYIADVAHREMPNVSRCVEQRRHVVAILAGDGMSQRAIADALGVASKTRQLRPDDHVVRIKQRMPAK
jgi:hypothetical protein